LHQWGVVWRAPCPTKLREGVPERLGVVADPAVSAEDRHQCRRLTKQFGGGEVDGVERSDWLNREGAPRPPQDVLRHGHEVALASERFERLNGGALLCLAQPAGSYGSDERALGLGEGQKGCNALFARAEGALDCGILFE
jgi:hypothetical protein